MTLRVAVSGISGDVGRGAVRGLRLPHPDDEPIWVLGMDGVTSQPACMPLLDAFVRPPLVKEPDYIDVLIATLQAHRIEVMFCGVDSEIPVLQAARSRLEASGTKVVLAPDELIDAAKDKLATADYLSRRGISTPITCDASNPVAIAFPIIAKPRHGHSSHGVLLLSDQDKLQAFLDTKPQDYCLQKAIEGPEITVGFLYDSQGHMRDAIAMERSLENGRTVRASVVTDPAILRFIEDFGSRVPGCGAINAQLRVDEQEGPMVFEINPRLSGSTEMRVAVGVNDPLRLAFHFGRGVPIQRARPQCATVFRSGSELRVTR